MLNKFLFIGCGKMGSAILQNFLKNNIDLKNIVIVDPENELANFKSLAEIENYFQADVVIFAIKPQNSEVILKEFAKTKLFHHQTIFVSILAGKKIEFFENILGKNKKIIRLMPNLPILISEGISAYFCNKNLQKNEEKELVNLFGQNLKLEKEDLINQVTAISGSGPAYLFLFAKNLVEAGLKIGLKEEDAKKLVIQTLFGAVKMLDKEVNSKNSDFDDLIKSVASKGGTTEAALNIFNNSKSNSLKELVESAIEAAFQRSKELSS